MASLGFVRYLRRVVQFRYEITTKTIHNHLMTPQRASSPTNLGKQYSLRALATKGSLTRAQICRHQHHLIIKSRPSSVSAADGRRREGRRDGGRESAARRAQNGMLGASIASNRLPPSLPPSLPPVRQVAAVGLIGIATSEPRLTNCAE